MTLWMYFQTDGDAGYYGVKLFSTKEKAEAYKKSKNNAYGNIKEIGVDDGQT